MSQQYEDVFEKLRKFVETEIPSPRPPNLLLQTELFNNLKMAEDDAEDFLSKWFELNNIDIGDFQFSRYFPPKGLWLLSRLKKAPHLYEFR